MSLIIRGNTYWIDLTLDGKRVRQSTKTSDLKRAEKLHKQLEVQLWNDSFNPTANKRAGMTLEQGLTKAFKEHWQHQKSWSTTQNNIKVVLSLMNPQTALANIDYKLGMSLVLAMRAKGCEPGGINRKLAILSKMLSLAVEWGEITAIPKLPTQKESKGRIRVISPKELEKILAALETLEKPQIALAVLVLVHTGMRLGELVRLKAENIDLPNRMIHLFDTKNGESRSQPMNDTVYGIMSSNPNGLGLTKDQIQWHWQVAREAIGLKGDSGFVIHALRHTAASRLVNKGASTWLVQSYLGHKSIATTQKYVHLNKDLLRSAADLLNDYSEE